MGQPLFFFYRFGISKFVLKNWLLPFIILFFLSTCKKDEESSAGYVDFFLFNDIVDENYSKIKFWLPFNNFDSESLPKNVAEYRIYKQNLTEYINKRNHRILKLNL